MHYDQDASSDAHAQHQKPIYAGGILFIEKLRCVLVIKNRQCFVERYAMLTQVCPSLAGIPIELEPAYTVSMYGKASR
jgi:hypothetical protein